MSENFEPILPQTPLEGICIRVAGSGISPGAPAQAQMLDDGQIAIFTTTQHRLFGLFRFERCRRIGQLSALASQIIAPALEKGIALRIRLVQITPEHLSADKTPDVQVSIWADSSKLLPHINIAALYPKSAYPLQVASAVTPE